MLLVKNAYQSFIYGYRTLNILSIYKKFSSSHLHLIFLLIVCLDDLLNEKNLLKLPTIFALPFAYLQY